LGKRNSNLEEGTQVNEDKEKTPALRGNSVKRKRRGRLQEKDEKTVETRESGGGPRGARIMTKRY